MKYYIDDKGEIFAYEEDGSQDDLIGDKQQISEEEVKARINPPPTYEELVAQAENERQQLLKHADAVMLDWRTELMLAEISDNNRAKLSAWLTYKNEVKAVDVTTDPERVNWPQSPED